MPVFHDCKRPIFFVLNACLCPPSSLLNSLLKNYILVRLVWVEAISDTISDFVKKHYVVLADLPDLRRILQVQIQSNPSIAHSSVSTLSFLRRLRLEIRYFVSCFFR